MPKRPDNAPQSLAASLKPLLRTRKARVSLGEMVDRIDDDDGVGPVLFVMTLPVLAPMPPGVSMVLALPLLLIAPQIVVGRRELWLPQWLRNRTIERAKLIKLLKRVLPIVTRAETAVRPRLQFLTGRLGARMIGVACTVIAVVLVLPIPFANLVPALTLGTFSLGLTRRDGLLVLAGYALFILAGAVIALGVHGVSLGVSRLHGLI
jgi:hypothetical protein